MINQALRSQAVGRRKEAVARVRLTQGVGQITVNGMPASDYFKGEVAQKFYMRPFEIAKATGKYSVSAKIIGGGQSSQLGALIHGLARSLDKIDSELHSSLKLAGLLTRDPRARERRKFGLAHGARAKKQSPKR